MKKKLSKLIFNVQVNAREDSHEFEAQCHVINADTLVESYNKSIVVGKQSEVVFQNSIMQEMRWCFIDVSDIYEINQNSDLLPLFTYSLDEYDSLNFKDFIFEKTKRFKRK